MQSSSGKKSGSWKSKFQKVFEDCKNTLELFSSLPKLMSLIWRASPGYATLAALGSILLGALPFANLWMSKMILDLTIGALSKSPLQLSTLFSMFSTATLIPLLLVKACIQLFYALVLPTTIYFDDILANKLSRSINKQLLEKTNSFVDIAFFESSEFYDSLQNVKEESSHRPLSMLQALGEILGGGVTFLALAVSLWSLQPVLCLMVCAFSFPAVILRMKQHRESYDSTAFGAQSVRKMNYYGSILTNRTDASEIRLFGLGDFFLGKYLNLFDENFAQHKIIKIAHLKQRIFWKILETSSQLCAYSWVALRTITGNISIGSFYLYTNLLSRIENSIGNLVYATEILNGGIVFANRLHEFLEMEPTMSPNDPTWALKAPKPIKHGIEFRNVTFAYPGSEREVISGLNFTLAPNQAIALVGENGAGKTTIVKLLSRLHDPSEGEILVDGINLKDMDLDSWREQMAVIFQDFSRYQMTARENIGVGQLNFIDDEIRIEAAADRGGATPIIKKFVRGWDTILGHAFGSAEEASDLSGGEWQRIALARAFMRAPRSEFSGIDTEIEKHLKDGAAQILVLDEPTASLDVQSEHDIYLKFQELTEGKISVLISHRFSTVRMASRILYLENGKITEQGSHDELMELGGNYAYLYKLQSDRYK